MLAPRIESVVFPVKKHEFPGQNSWLRHGREARRKRGMQKRGENKKYKSMTKARFIEPKKSLNFYNKREKNIEPLCPLLALHVPATRSKSPQLPRWQFPSDPHHCQGESLLVLTTGLGGGRLAGVELCSNADHWVAHSRHPCGGNT